VVDMIEFCTRELPRMHPISISGYHICEAGSNAAQELAFTLADGFAYVDAALGGGWRWTSSRRVCSSTHIDFFEEIGTVLRIWARELATVTAKDPLVADALPHADGGRLTAQQPHEHVRTALEAMAAVLGGRSRCTRTRSTRRSRCPPRRR
jgi:methylmalonyl-CoA mutase N-terminal domain/subunit